MRAVRVPKTQLQRVLAILATDGIVPLNEIVLFLLDHWSTQTKALFHRTGTATGTVVRVRAATSQGWNLHVTKFTPR